MSLRSARWVKGNGMILAVACDICLGDDEGDVDALRADGWQIQSVAITPHVCPQCAPAFHRDLGRDAASA
ncbi:MAG: hypothetical protein ACJ76Z_06435 [Thermoleophilaceae bacterium]